VNPSDPGLIGFIATLAAAFGSVLFVRVFKGVAK